MTRKQYYARIAGLVMKRTGKPHVYFNRYTKRYAVTWPSNWPDDKMLEIHENVEMLNLKRAEARKMYLKG